MIDLFLAWSRGGEGEYTFRSVRRGRPDLCEWSKARRQHSSTLAEFFFRHPVPGTAFVRRQNALRDGDCPRTRCLSRGEYILLFTNKQTNGFVRTRAKEEAESLARG